jgi:predicted enzyme related to lactoylglutathione lyase
MTTPLAGLVIEAARPTELAGFWAALLGWEATAAVVRAPSQPGSGEPDLIFVPESGPKKEKNRIHLDLASSSAEEQRAKVERAAALGARPWDIGQGVVPWEVMIDPEGNEFCVLGPRPRYTTTVAAIVVDAVDPLPLASFWAETTGWRIGAQEPVIVGLRDPSGRGSWLEFLLTTEPRHHPDRLRLGVAGGPGQAGVRVDPEGNEFLLLEGS